MRIESKNLENGVSERRKEAQSFMEGKSSRQDSSSLRERILAASGEKRAGLVLKGARVVNVFTGELEEADVAIEAGYIAGVGSYEGETEVDLSGKIICPGFIDGHIHLESSMVRPAEFERAVLPHGTTAVITDPHEIANVAGTEGIDYMLYETENLMLDVFFMLPSCVPAADLEESGAVLRAEDLRAYYENPRVLGLAEMMNAPGTVKAEEGVLAKLKDCSDRGKRIDPFIHSVIYSTIWFTNPVCYRTFRISVKCLLRCGSGFGSRMLRSRGSAGKAAAGTVDHDPRGNSSQKSGRTYCIMQAALCKPMYVCYG